MFLLYIIKLINLFLYEINNWKVINKHITNQWIYCDQNLWLEYKSVIDINIFRYNKNHADKILFIYF